jgi:hypothetical protein
MPQFSWSDVRNKENECAEFAAVHSNFAWRKHHSSRFGQLKNNTKKCADDSLSRAFSSDLDSIRQLFSPEGNRTLRDHPEYGPPKFALVWYESERWAILCTENEAVLVSREEVSSFKRVQEGASERIRLIQSLWDSSDQSTKVSLTQVAALIA